MMFLPFGYRDEAAPNLVVKYPKTPILGRERHLDPSSRLTTIDMGRKFGVLCPFFRGGELGPHLTKSPWPRPTSVPSGILIHPAVWPQRTARNAHCGQRTFRLSWCHEHSAATVTELLQPQNPACGTLFQSNYAIRTSPTDFSDDG